MGSISTTSDFSVTTIPSVAPLTPTVANVSVALKDIEASYALPVGTKLARLKLRSDQIFRLAFATGGPDAGTGTFVTTNCWESPVLDSSNSVTIYLETFNDVQVVEIETWQ